MQLRRAKPSGRKAAAETKEEQKDSYTYKREIASAVVVEGEHFGSLYKYDIFKLDSHTFILGLD